MGRVTTCRAWEVTQKSFRMAELWARTRASMLIMPGCPPTTTRHLQRLVEAGLWFLRSPTNAFFGSLQRPLNMQFSSVLALAAFTTTSLAQQCYYPSGKVATADIPCSTSSDKTHCCGKTGICLSNGYCMETSEDSGPLGLYRGSCTDRNWGASCPQKCLAGKPATSLGISRQTVANDAISDNDFPADAARVARWKKNGTDWLYCCVGSNYDNDYSSACADDAEPFALPSASLVYGVAALSSAELKSSTATSTATSAASATAAIATAPSATASETAASAAETCPDSGAQIGAIGAGVGVSLGVISIGALVWAFWERRKRLRQTAPVVQYSKPGYEVPGGSQYANSSTPTAYSPHTYSTPPSVGHTHELGPNEHKAELPGSIMPVSGQRN